MFPEREKRMMSAFAFGFGAAKSAGEAAAIAAAETPVRNVRREINFVWFIAYGSFIIVLSGCQRLRTCGPLSTRSGFHRALQLCLGRLQLFSHVLK